MIISINLLHPTSFLLPQNLFCGGLTFPFPAHIIAESEEREKRSRNGTARESASSAESAFTSRRTVRPGAEQRKNSMLFRMRRVKAKP